MKKSKIKELKELRTKAAQKFLQSKFYPNEILDPYSVWDTDAKKDNIYIKTIYLKVRTDLIETYYIIEFEPNTTKINHYLYNRLKVIKMEEIKKKLEILRSYI